MQAYSKILLIFNLFCSIICFSQTLSENELLDIWSITDRTQTKEALRAYEDLSDHFDEKKYKNLINGLSQNSKIKKDERLQVRFVLYKANAEVLLRDNLHSTLKNDLKNSITSALMLGDEQLLSEIYSLYYEQGFGNPDEKLYYISKTVETQEKIGAEYFPKLFFRYYNLSLGYYRAQDYVGSIEKGLKGLRLLPSPKSHLDYYCFFLDLLGTNYYEIGNTEKSLEYYLKLQNTLSEYQKNYKDYKGRFSNYDSQFTEIWKGIANGGIARVLIEKNNFEKASELLQQNLKSSERYNLEDDIAKVYNLQGDIAFKNNDFSKAIERYQNSLGYSTKIEDSKNTIKSLLALANTHKELKQYDKAYDYSMQYYTKKSEVEQDISKRKYSIISEKLNQENLKNSIEEAQVTIKKQETTRNINLLIFTISILAIGILGRILYLRQKLRITTSENKRLNTEMELEEQKKEVQIAEIQLEKLRQKLAQNTKIIEAFEIENQQQNSKGLHQLKQTTILTNEDWNEFKKQFESAYPHFLVELKENHSELSQAELRYLCLAKLGLTSSEIASALGVSPASLRVTKHRIKKKINDESDNFIDSLIQ